MDSKKVKFIADYYGYDSQSRQLIEEMGELTTAINHVWRQAVKNGIDPKDSKHYHDVLEEIADVKLCLEQLIYLIGDNDYIDQMIDDKIERQLKKGWLYIMKSPCIDCERKGCGVYHDICEPYLEYKKYKQEIRKKKEAATKHITHKMNKNYYL